MNSRSVLLLCLIVFMVIKPWGQCINILAVFPHMGKSHLFSCLSLFKALAQKGHNVTMLSNFPLKKPFPNFHDVDMGGLPEVMEKEIDVSLDLKNIDSSSKLLMHRTAFNLAQIGQMSCEAGLSSTAVKKFLKEDNNFDIAVIEYFNTDCFLPMAKMYNVPVIRFHSGYLMPWTSYRYGNPNNPAYIPNHFMPFSHKMSFLQRVESAVATVIHSLYFNNFVVVNSDENIARRYFGQFAESIKQDVFNDSLLLLATHYTVNFPRPIVPNIVEVGGIHIGKPDPLPKNLEKWIKESPHGVIYFSFGSLVKGYTMPADKRQAFINAFKRLPQRVIWKWENDTMEGKSDNIMIGKWLPQFDILSHPNVKAFISHGGLLGTFEAVHCGVPILVMPQFGDQHTNAKAIESVGGGEILYLSDATEEKIYNALTKILSPSFQQQAKELSERFRDRPMPPLETAIYWVEYVARHKGAHFMKTAAVGMPFYQYYLLDVIAFLLAVLILFLYLVYLVLRFFVRLVFKPKQPTKVKKS